MNGSYKYSFDSIRIIVAIFFFFFAYNLKIGLGAVISIMSGFSIPFIFMVFGFLTLSYRKGKKTLLRFTKRNFMVFCFFAIGYFLLNFALAYYRGRFLTVSVKQILNLLIFNVWPFRIGKILWMPLSLTYAGVIFWLLKKYGLLQKRWLRAVLLVVTLFIGIFSSEFAGVFGLPLLEKCFITRAIPHMLIGCVIYHHRKQLKKLTPAEITGIILLGAFLSYVEFYVLSKLGVEFLLGNTIGNIITAIGVMLICIRVPNLGRATNLHKLKSAVSWMILLSDPIGLALQFYIPELETELSYLRPFMVLLVSFGMGLVFDIFYRYGKKMYRSYKKELRKDAHSSHHHSSHHHSSHHHSHHHHSSTDENAATQNNE